jgi:hypothetical protein
VPPHGEAECGRGSAQVAKQWDAAKGEAEERIGAMRRFLEQSWRRPDPDENAPG